MSWKTITLIPIALVASLLAFEGCSKSDLDAASTAGAGDEIRALMEARGLSEADVSAALKTFTPTGKRDDYIIFASGGHGGNLILIGVPSMRILKYVGVFTPEPWQGWGFDEESKRILKEGSRDGHTITWGDMHHPALSETAGDYDGQFVFVNDKANARVAVINLKDFMTTQIVASELIESDHGSTFVTPNTEYVIETAQFATPLGGGYAPLDQYNDAYRGAVILWHFDRDQGRLIEEKSFAIELPPYMQDIGDAGKLDSHGFIFFNSINTELATGGTLEGKPPLESGASQNDMDYLHVVDWKKAEAVYKAGKTKKVAGMNLISLETAIAEGLLHFIPEPKSPHGVDVSPTGKDIVISGKLDTHATVYDFAKVKALIESKTYAGKDAYGVPILDFEASIRGQVEMGLGPLHTQFDSDGYGYTSLFLESKVARWSLKDLKVKDKISIHYNIGHLVAAEGDTVSPDGKYVVAMNKWAIDRFNDVGPLLPQNFQLIDTSGDTMQLLYDMPLPLGEPHYAQMIKADKLKPIDVYTPAGMNATTHEADAFAVAPGEERIERKADGVHVYMTAVRSRLTPDAITVKQGDTVFLHITNTEQAKDATHGFALNSFNVNLSIEPGRHVNATFVADTPGVYPFYCTEFCSALHLEMAGYLLVEPKK